jgi:uncharacterized protein CbrC (UPF0167 family)
MIGEIGLPKIPAFKYFHNPLHNAAFTDKECQFCGSHEYCLEGVYFDRGDEVESVCLSCLQAGDVTVNLPDYVIQKIASVQDENSANESTETLRRTPPVPWIQYNDWVVCCGDFGRYIGEWDRDKLIQESPDGDGMKYLISLLDEFSLIRVQNSERLWKSIGVDTAVFVFECLTCGKRKAVVQSY